MKDMNIKVESTPNPNALKFIMDRQVIDEGKATFYTGDTCPNVLARDLLSLSGVQQVHFFDNVISITKGEGAITWQQLSPQVQSVLLTRLHTHNPHFNKQKIQYEKERLRQLSP